LNVLVHDGALPIDDNQVERLMKLIAIVRKNGWFIGSLRRDPQCDPDVAIYKRIDWISM
jgi:hypothetical protein